MKKRSNSNRQNNAETAKKPKCALLEEYFDYSAWGTSILTTTNIERIAADLVEWAEKNEEAIKMSQFVVRLGIDMSTWNRWCIAYEVLGKAQKVAKMHISNRRELGSLTRKFDQGQAAFMMPLYDEDWKQMVEWRSNLNKKDEGSGGEKWIVMEKYPESNMVPKKKED